MDERTRRHTLDAIDERTASLIEDMSRRHSQPDLAPRIAAAPRPPASPAPRPTPSSPPRQPAPARPPRRLLEAIGRVIAVTKAETDAKHRADMAALAERADEHQRQLAQLAERIDALERSRRGSKVVDMTSLIGRRATG